MNGEEAVFAYGTVGAPGFGAGSAGFCIDPSTNTITNAHVREDTLGLTPPPRVSFTSGGGIGFDFNDDGIVDQAVPSCTDPAVVVCH